MPESHKTQIYIVVVAAVASVVGWVFMFYFKPQIIEAGCSDVAQRSSGLLYKDRELLDPTYSYDNLKARCLENQQLGK